MKKLLKTLVIILSILLVLGVGYLAYVMITYERIPDNQVLEPEGKGTAASVELDRTYNIVTQNVGFGAYSPDFTFFMDGGKESWGRSREEVLENIDKAAESVKALDPDFIFFQEVDTGSTRSYHIDQWAQFDGFFPEYSSVFAVNYHSAFLMYPLTKPHGASNSGLLTYSSVGITSGLRRSFEVSNGFSKFLDLDRCYSISRVPVENGKELVLFNVHTSAYGGSDTVRTAQITKLTQDMLAEYEKGNYAICGGDFNHDFTGDSAVYFGGDPENLGWTQPFPRELLPDGIHQCLDYGDDPLNPTCRNVDVPYTDPDCQFFIVDGFLVSDNVDVVGLHNIDREFAYSDHNPVLLSFELH